MKADRLTVFLAKDGFNKSFGGDLKNWTLDI